MKKVLSLMALFLTMNLFAQEKELPPYKEGVILTFGYVHMVCPGGFVRGGKIQISNPRDRLISIHNTKYNFVSSLTSSKEDRDFFEDAHDDACHNFDSKNPLISSTFGVKGRFYKYNGNLYFEAIEKLERKN